MLANVRSIKGKILEINALFIECCFLCLTETHLDGTIDSGELFDTTEVSVYRLDRNMHGGGVLIAARNDIIHHRIQIDLDINCAKFVEVVAICIPKQAMVRKSIVIACIYMPPCYTSYAVEPMTEILDSLTSRYSSSVIWVTGDFNMPDIEWYHSRIKDGSRSEKLHQDFMNCFIEYGFHQLISSPTHIKGNTLDLVFVNSDDRDIVPSVVNPGLSDHYLVELEMSYLFENVCIKKPPRTIKLYDKADSDAIAIELQKTTLEIQAEIESRVGVDQVWQHFCDSLSRVVDLFVPTLTFKSRTESEPVWFNRKARKLVSKQRRLYNKYKRTGRDLYIEQYRICRKENKRFFRNRHREYLKSRLFEPLSRGDSKAFYSFIKSKTGSKGEIKSLHSSKLNETLEKPGDIANELNDFFKSVFNPMEEYTHIRGGSKSSITVGVEGVKNLIKKLKPGKASGPDQIGKRELSLALDETADILTLIFQYSLDSARLPSVWKSANVTPIHKGGSRLNASNYRPVSLTSICCKMLEHIILHNMSKRMKEILIPNQHGFREGLSCTTQLLTTTQTIINEIDQGRCVQAAILDFAKAFDKVPHSLLLQKMQMYGFSDDVVLWIADFLADRRQRVVVQGSFSEYQAVTSGVPQGSVLGPALFLIYINDISCSLSSNIRLFADDAFMHLTMQGPDSAEIFQKDLQILSDWASKWKMSFNTSKCSIVIFGQFHDSQATYRLDGVALKYTSSFKYLGLRIHNSFNWECHINNIHSEASRTLGLLRRALYGAPSSVKAIAYKTLCRPKLEYAAEVWDPCLAKHADRLEMLQNKAVRFILNIKGRSGVTDGKIELGLEPLADRRKDQRMKMFSKILQESENPSYNELYSFVNNCFKYSEHNTRLQSRGMPVALHSFTSVNFNSFIPRTGRELRK